MRLGRLAVLALLATLSAGCGERPARKIAEGPDRRPSPAVESKDARGFPQLALSNGVIKAFVYLPDPVAGYYRGPRFDWSGLVSRVEWGRHVLFAPWKDAHNPANHDDVHGTAEEFGMEMPLGPLGYPEAKDGETFLKIGVGVLEKPKEARYGFWTGYRIVRPGAWRIAHDGTWVEFRQDLAGDRGWSYSYTKRVELLEGEAAFRILHVLRNTGEKAIETSHYGHNFINFDGRPIGPGVRIRLPYPIKTSAFRAGNAAEVRGREIVFTGEPSAFWASLAEVQPENRFEVEDTEAGFGVRVSGDLAPFKFNIWGQKRVICPEPHVALRIPPGQSQAWTHRYELYPVAR